LNEGFARITPNLLVFVSGMSLMITEMVAGRIVAKEIGSSLYTWTSVIGVILSGIALGNYVGGKLADRFEPRRTLTNLFLLSSIMAISVIFFYDGMDQHRIFLADVFARYRPGDPADIVAYPNWLNDTERATWPYVYGSFARTLMYPLTPYPVWVVGIVAAAFLLPAAMMGTISPVVSKLALERSEATGETIGNIYAWGAFGSIVGTFLPSYLLIAVFGTRGVVCLTSALLAVTAIALPASGVVHTLWGGLALVAVLGATVPSGNWIVDDYDSPQTPLARLSALADRARGGIVHMGNVWRLRSPVREGLYERESNYFYIKVFPQDRGESRTLRLDHLIHGYVFEGKPRALKYEYEQIYASIMERAGAMPLPDPDDSQAVKVPGSGRPLRTLFIGGGSYTFPRYIQIAYPGSEVEVSEIDPAVTEAVHEAMYLPRDTPIRTIYGDARNTVDQLLERGEQFDFVYGDAFNDLSVPWHLTTYEFNQRVEKLLKPDGVYLINIIDSFGNAKFIGSFVNTARKTFPFIVVYSTEKETKRIGRDTFVIAMAKQALDLNALGTRPGERKFIGWPFSQADLKEIVDRSGHRLLTDDFAPVDNLLAPVAKER
jgi:MFS family permease